MITQGQERCLHVFPMAEFARITEALRDRADHREGAPRLLTGCSFAERLTTRCRTGRAGSPSRRALRDVRRA